MITLKDYVGNIYKEITKARVQADIETVEVAQEYAKHDLLKHFSVPNMRMKNVEITLPVAIDSPEVRLPKVGETTVVNSVLKAVGGIVKETEGKKTISPIHLRKLKELTKSNTRLLGTTGTGGKLDLETKKLTTFVNKTADNHFAILKPQLGGVSSTNFKKLLNTKVTSEIAKISKAELERIPVIIETSKLRDVKERDAIMNIKITIEEDTMEWMRDVDDEGNPTQYLSYE